MASTNAFLTLVSTVQTDKIGSTISTGYIPYVSTAGRQTYTSTLSTITVSTLLTNTMTYPSNTTNVATTAYVTSATNSLLNGTNTWSGGSNVFNNTVSIGSAPYNLPFFNVSNFYIPQLNRTTFTLTAGAANQTGLYLPSIPLYGSVNPVYHVFATTTYPGPTSSYNNQWYGSAHCMFIQSNYGTPQSTQFCTYNLTMQIEGSGQIVVYTQAGGGTYNAQVAFYRVF